MLLPLLFSLFSRGLSLTLPGSLRPEKPSLAVSSISSTSKNSVRHPITRTSRDARCDDSPGHRRCVFPFNMWSRTFTSCTTYDGDDRLVMVRLSTTHLSCIYFMIWESSLPKRLQEALSELKVNQLQQFPLTSDQHWISLQSSFSNDFLDHQISFVLRT